jgi:DNA polymerase III subunit epsilon
MFDKFFHRSQAQPSAEVQDGPQRWIVLDTETTGLSLWRDRVISIAAVAMHVEPDLTQARIVFADSFEAVIHQEKPKASKENILIHHIGVAAQSQGLDREAVLKDFAQWAGDAPLFAYHAPFDKAMMANSYKKAGLPGLHNDWTDIQPLANWLTRQSHMLGLDECMEIFELTCIARHQASADTFLTAELLLKMLPALREKAQNWRELHRFSQQNVMKNTI